MNIREELLHLENKRVLIEERIKVLSAQLSNYESKNYHRDLTDKEGFPREDLDYGELVNYKNIKREMNEMQNDYTSCMKILESKLYAFHEILINDPNVQSEMNSAPLKNIFKGNSEEKKDSNEIPQEKFEGKIEIPKLINLIPFAIISEVSPKSPAQAAGIEVGDLIIRIGGIDLYNNNNLQGLALEVKNHFEKEISLQILRENLEGEHEFKGKFHSNLNLTLTPRNWEGQGTLGCRFVKI